MAQTVVVLVSGTSWPVPSDCSLIDSIELWGGNASGAAPHGGTGFAGGGGGAGAYAKWINLSTSPGDILTYAIGAGGPRKNGAAGTDGGPTSITIGSTTYSAAGGAKGLSGTAGTGGAGGAGGPATTTPTPSASYKGGDGAQGLVNTRGGGGGGSPGTTGAGGNASAGTGGVAGTGGGTAGGNAGTTGSPNGVDGANPDGLGLPGSAGGGGYCPATLDEHSGSGGNGQIVIKYTPVSAPTRVANLIGFDVARGTWATANAIIGPGDTHRLFSGSTGLLPATFDADGTPSTVTIIQSYKVRDTNVASYCASVPSNRNVILIYHHEPENKDYTLGSTFVAEFKTQSDLIRAQGRTNIKVAMCSSGYAYRSSGDPDVLAGNYLKGLGPYVDMFTKDIYQGAGGTAAWNWSTNGLANLDMWTNWLSLVTDSKIVGTVKPLGITEYGVDDFVGDSLRYDRIGLDHDYLVNAFTPGGPQAVSPYPLQMWCYWWQDLANDPNPAKFTDAATEARWVSYETAAGSSPTPVVLSAGIDLSLQMNTSMSTGGAVITSPPPTAPALGFPQIFMEIGFYPATPVASPGTLILDDTVNGKLDTARLGDSTSWTDISAYLISGTINHPSTREQGPVLTYEASTANAIIDISDGQLDPNNPNSSYVDSQGKSLLHSMVPVRARATFMNVEYQLFQGFLDNILPPEESEYDSPYSEATLSATDGFKVLEGKNIRATTGIAGAGELSGARIKRILDQAGWFTDHRVIDTGVSEMQGTSYGDSALNLIKKIAESELGELYIDGAGNIRFRNRHAILTESRSAVSQATFGDGPGELPYKGVPRANDDTMLANDVSATIVNGKTQIALSPASIRKYMFPRTYDASDLMLTSDDEALQYANWIVYVSKDVSDRFDSITINPLADRANLFPQVLGRQIGDRITVKRRPANLGGSVVISRDCFIRGIEHTIDVANSTWETTWTLQDADKYGNFFVLEDPNLGKLDSAALAF